MKRRFLISALMLITVFKIAGQDIDNRQYIQIDGLTLDETGVIIPNVGIYSLSLNRGAASDGRGIFSIISTPGDTIIFTLPGFRATLLTIPPQLSSTNYITDVQIVRDTITIDEVIVLPWKTYSEFKKAVAGAKTTTPETEFMEYNIALVKQQLYDDLKATPGMGYRYTMQQMADNLYTRGQMPANNLLNPIAWSRFIKGLKTGMLKNNDPYKKKGTKAKVRKKKIKK